MLCNHSHSILDLSSSIFSIIQIMLIYPEFWKMPITEQFGSTFLLCILLLQVVYFRISGAPSSILWGMNLRATDNRSSFVGTFLTLGSAPLVRSHLQMHSSLESSSQSSDFENLSKNKSQIKAVFESNWPLQKTLNKDEWQDVFHHPGTQYPCIYATPGTRRRSLGKAEWCKDRQKGSFWTQSLTCWRTAPRCGVVHVGVVCGGVHTGVV